MVLSWADEVRATTLRPTQLWMAMRATGRSPCRSPSCPCSGARGKKWAWQLRRARLNVFVLPVWEASQMPLAWLRLPGACSRCLQQRSWHNQCAGQCISSSIRKSHLSCPALPARPEDGCLPMMGCTYIYMYIHIRTHTHTYNFYIHE